MEGPPGFPAAVSREPLDVGEIHANDSPVPCHLHTVELLGGRGCPGVRFDVGVK